MDLYAAGSGSKEIDDFKRKIGFNQLLSQYNERRALLKWVDYLRQNPECKCKLFVDSGAYTAHTKGVTIDVDDYIKLINSIDDQVYVFAQVDKIPGVWGQPKTIQQQMEAPKQSWDNYLYMVDKVKSPGKLIPIFHQGEDFKWLRNMLNYKYTSGELKGQYIKYIGISCNKELSSKDWCKWFEEVFKVIKTSANPNVRTHAFGTTSTRVLEQFPFTSADSTSWVRTASFGRISYKGSLIYVSKRNEHSDDYILNKSPAVIKAISDICDRIGISLKEILDDNTGESKCMFNLYSLKEWQDNYRYLGNAEFKESLW